MHRVKRVVKKCLPHVLCHKNFILDKENPSKYKNVVNDD